MSFVVVEHLPQISVSCTQVDEAMAYGPAWPLLVSAAWTGPGENVDSDWQVSDVLVPVITHFIDSQHCGLSSMH